MLVAITFGVIVLEICSFGDCKFRQEVTNLGLQDGNQLIEIIQASEDKSSARQRKSTQISR
jgi:hypothetical protein